MNVQLVNPVPVEEARGWVTNLASALLNNPHDADFDKRVARWESQWLPERTWGARSDGRWVATLATQPRTLTVPAPDGTTRDLPADALTGVSVNPTHRRRGLLTAMIGESLAAARERGDAVSILIAAEWPIYGRFGYGPAVVGADYSYFPRQPGAAIAPYGGGTVRQVDFAEMHEHAFRIFDAARRARAGQVDRFALWWSRYLAQDGWSIIGTPPQCVLHEGPGGPDGALFWHVTRDFELDGRLGVIEVDDLFAANPTAYRNLWAYLSGIDVIEEIVLRDRPVDEPARWLPRDGRSLRLRYAGDFMWVRLLDVPAALTARSYGAPGRVVLEVHDTALGFASGRYLLETSGAEATCVATSEPADLEVSVQALGSAYLGGYSLAALTAGGGVVEARSGALVRASAMFATPLAPWTATGF